MELNRNNDQSKISCKVLMKSIKWIPVLIVSCIIFWSYYAYAYELCYTTIGSSYKKVIYLITYNVIFLMFFLVIFAYGFNETRKSAGKIQNVNERLRTFVARGNGGNAKEFIRRVFKQITKY